jgi:hypothetical protein
MRRLFLLSLVLATCSAFCAVPSLGLAPRASSFRVPSAPLAVARSKEAQANIDKWGKILSQADTFDDTLPVRRGKAPKKKPPGDERAGASIVVFGSAAVLLAMALSQVGH